MLRLVADVIRRRVMILGMRCRIDAWSVLAQVRLVALYGV